MRFRHEFLAVVDLSEVRRVLSRGDTANRGFPGLNGDVLQVTFRRALR